MKKFLKVLLYLILFIVFLIIAICVWHNVCNVIEKKSITIPGDRIKIYEDEYIHAVKMGDGKYSIVLLPGMGTSSPYYDYYYLANELSKTNTVIVVEPLGYGFSDNTSKERTLDNYENELFKIFNYYNIKDNIILLGHSYSGLSNLNYSNKHREVKGLVCLDCTSAYQIETHVKDGNFIEEVPKESSLLSVVSPIGLSRFAFKLFMKSSEDELMVEVPDEYKNAYRYLLYNKTLNKTIINEVNDIYYNQLELLNKKYRSDLYVITFLSDETILEMKKYKNDGDFYHDWEEMHNLIISNNEIQHIYVLKGNHYIHHGNVKEITDKINEMINNISVNSNDSL